MADFGSLIPPENGRLEDSALMAELGRRIDPQNWDAMLNAFASSGNIEDRRAPQPPSLSDVWEDMKRNNFIARWFRNGKYSGPGYDYEPWPKTEPDDPVAIALGRDHIPITSFGTTHPLKRYNPDYNSGSPRLPWNRP